MSAVWCQGGVGVVEGRGGRVTGPRVAWAGVVKGSKVALTELRQAEAGFALCCEHGCSPTARSQSPWRSQASHCLLGSRLGSVGVQVSEVWDHEEPVSLCPGAHQHVPFLGSRTLNHQHVFVLSPVGVTETRSMATGVSSITNRSFFSKDESRLVATVWWM